MANIVRIGILAALWGSTFLWIKVALRGFSATQVTFGRMIIGAAFLWLVVWLIKRKRLQARSVPWRHLIVSAALANAIPYLLFALGEEGIDSSAAGVTNSTTPIWTMLVALLVGDRRGHTRRRASGLVLGFLGCVLIFSPWHTGTDIMSWGGLECLIGSAFLAVSYIYMAKYLTNRGIPPLMLAAYQLSAAGLLLAPVLLVDGVPTLTAHPDALAALAILGLFGTGIAYILNFRIIADDGSVAASVVTYLLPVVSIILGAVVLQEHVTATMLIGVGVVLVAVALTQNWRASSANSELVDTEDEQCARVR
ncbi:drug/metabolite transporter (DMT)-like permease [Nocardia tenerifensis]|uniref:Drug/metabolite transporter (DMT)-like permease n=1 Tax=Nocardia tenerifensis TaxID=228006 RepID=A0A318K2J7_9NOCA|nr:DMT family transporter [Nocardia tenerifensis]PXX55540.1 drug/metabolite transporter (DMT)-like permease [Nocardia tenerifensis]